MRRLRAGLVTSPPGGLGSPSVPTKGDCLEWLDAARMKGGESRLDQGSEELPVGARKHSPGDKNRRNGAPCGERVDRKTRARHAPPEPKGEGGRKAERLMVRHPALHPLAFWRGAAEGPAAAGRDDGVPGADKEHG